MRLVARILLAAALAALPLGVAVVSCGTDAVGIDACRKIETARCNLAPQCSPGFDVDRCTRFYKDECLVGVENVVKVDGGDPFDPNPLAQACVDALNALAACVDAGAAPCPGADLVPDASCGTADAPATACNIILVCPEILSACSFVAAPVDAGAAPTDAGSDADAGDMADADAG